MAGARRVRTILAAVIAGTLGVGQAHGSGYDDFGPWYISVNGGDAHELQRLYAGRLGVVMAGSSRPMLYLDWRLLHGLKVGPTAGPALSGDCCTPMSVTEGREGGVFGWLEARKLVSGAAESPSFIDTERPWGNYETLPNCFRDAFDTASATLKDRVTRYGAAAPAVQTWLAGQDAVFKACAHTGVEMPPTIADQPGWLRADRAYQAAALALYNGYNEHAATRFGDIARDPNSPWRSKGLYLRVRSLQRESLAKPSPATFARSRAAIGELAAAPDGTYGKGEVQGMLRALAYRDQPDQLLAQLDRELTQVSPTPDVAVGLRDYFTLSQKASTKPEIADWIDTLRPDTDMVDVALDHARERWARTHDVAWLLAALTLAPPDDPAAKALATEADHVPVDHPGWLTAQYHVVRLTIATRDPAATRARLDRILARKTLSASDRNLFVAERLQVANSLSDFARLSTRRPVADCGYSCAMSAQARSLYDGSMGPEFGEDARAVIDRMPLSQRIALSRDAKLATDLRLDVALTSYARAVHLQDDAAIDGLARDLARLLPQMKADWMTIATTPPGPAKRFAEFFAMAKIPGLNADLDEYTRPEGKVVNFQGRWEDWIILPRSKTLETIDPPALDRYQAYGVGYGEEGVHADLTCLGECGAGAFPLRLPNFVAAAQAPAAAQRASFVTGYETGDGPRKLPKGSLGAWEELLAYARAHPDDRRSSEALYWLIHITRWGPNHDQMSRRAFTLLHARYSTSNWAKRSPYYY